MSARPKLHLASDLKVGDHVMTPTGRKAAVAGFVQGRVDLRYLDDGETVRLHERYLTRIERTRGRPRLIAPRVAIN